MSGSVSIVSSNSQLSSDQSGSFFSSEAPSFRRPQYVDPKVAVEENRTVAYSKMLVIFVLLMGLSAVTSTMYFVIENEEKEDFEVQFQNYADQIFAVSKQNTISTLDVIDSFATTIESYAYAKKNTWPLVTIPNFAERIDRIVKVSHATRFAFCPIVESEMVDKWINYNAEYRMNYYQEGVNYLQAKNFTAETLEANTADYIFSIDYQKLFSVADILEVDYQKLLLVPDIPDNNGVVAPLWQGHPIEGSPLSTLTNYNILSAGNVMTTYETVVATQTTSLNFVGTPIEVVTRDEDGKLIGFGLNGWRAESVVIQPIFDKNSQSTNGEKKIVGVIWAMIDWVHYFENLLPETARGIFVVLKSSCRSNSTDTAGWTVTYKINGLEAEIIADSFSDSNDGDAHDPKYDKLKVTKLLFEPEYDRSKVSEDACVPSLTLDIYPSDEFKKTFETTRAILFAFGVVLVFAFTSLVLVLYDISVRRRQDKIMARIIRQDKIVSNMFPSTIRDRLYADGGESQGKRLHDDDGFDDDAFFNTGHIAELYPSVSLIFADISGFTAWSSQREPSQVFLLLETIYSKFDKIAYRYGVFKVETVGDCYVAVSGLPDRCENHVEVIAKFAREILAAMTGLTRNLEVSLGPDTTDLALRIGVHSGQVTAGVLRGERSRFQLFGDAVNVASRMESTGVRNRIQLSENSATLLREKGKGKWIKPREDSVLLKGKGSMNTFWLETKLESRKRYSKYKKNKSQSQHENKSQMDLINEEEEEEEDTEVDLDDDEENPDESHPDYQAAAKTERLVQWNAEVLGQLLQQILAARDASAPIDPKSAVETSEKEIGKGVTVLEEFVPIISLPEVAMDDLKKRRDPKSVRLSESARSQLHTYLSIVAGMYPPNPFHNFEHASHVTSSVRKLLTRIVNVDNEQDSAEARDSYGITNDPLTQFAVVFSAVIHDVDHPGIPNAQLVKENTRNAEKYKGKSIAEQNSVDLAWKVLMQNEFGDLRACIYSNEDELRRFRQLVVNTVMATDICDKELGALRKNRWAVAFSDEKVDSTIMEARNRKATIVIEHLIQASDVSHTMQHWHKFIQWNRRLFDEMYAAYKSGRAANDPSEGWYESEIGFFDFYIIPLAKKLDSCGVFGVSSHEYLNYATANRDEWVTKGRDCVKEYLASVESEYH